MGSAGRLEQPLSPWLLLAPVPRQNGRQGSQSEASCSRGPWESGAATEIGVLNPPPAARPTGPRLPPRPPLSEPRPGRGRGSESGIMVRDAPRGLRPPETRHQDRGRRASQALRAGDCLPAPSDNRGKAGMAEGRRKAGRH